MKKSLILAIVGIIVVAVITFALFQPRELVNPISVTTDKSLSNWKSSNHNGDYSCQTAGTRKENGGQTQVGKCDYWCKECLS